MAELAAAMPEFVSYRQCASADDEGVAGVEFESHEVAVTWRAHSEHSTLPATNVTLDDRPDLIQIAPEDQ